jgi:hypothetical protein
MVSASSKKSGAMGFIKPLALLRNDPAGSGDDAIVGEVPEMVRMLLKFIDAPGNE